MDLVRFFNKNLGETPLECLRRFQAENPEYADLKATYAGRLDPAAEGVMLFLFGDKVHKKDAYLAHDKTYVASFVLGIGTDTGDLLGLPTSIAPKDIVAQLDEEKIKKLSKEIEIEIKKVHEQKYPMYSSKTVAGKPLFAYAREGEEVEQPKRVITVRECVFKAADFITNRDILDRVMLLCSVVTGDFRQKEIGAMWKQQEDSLPPLLPLLIFKLTVSSGTYVRGFTETIENITGLPCVLFRLERTEVFEQAGE